MAIKKGLITRFGDMIDKVPPAQVDGELAVGRGLFVDPEGNDHFHDSETNELFLGENTIFMCLVRLLSPEAFFPEGYQTQYKDLHNC